MSIADIPSFLHFSIFIMRNYLETTITVVTICLMILASACKNSEKEPKITEYVNPFIDTAHGHCFPGATVPFGSTQLSPDTRGEGEDWCAGYHYSDSIISSFSHTHLSETGIGSLQDIRFLPVITTPGSNQETAEYIHSNYARYSHANEQAEPGYYAVTFDNGIKTELSTTEWCGIHYYQYPANVTNGLIIDLTIACNRDTLKEVSIKKINNRTLSGYRKSNDQCIYFIVEFSQDCHVMAGTKEFKNLANGQEIVADSCYVWIDFGKTTNKILAKVGISTENCDGATANLRKELPHWSFDKVKRDAKHLWRKELSKTKAEGKDEKQLEIFYTALYHAYRAPNIHAAHPLYTITQKKRVGDINNSMLKDKPSETDVDKILTAPDTMTPNGLCNNEDYGQMSAWHAFAAMGFNPVNPVEGKYQLGMPLFEKITIKVGPEKKFVITANKESDKHIYVKETILNGKKLDRTWITHDEIMQGGQLEFVLETQIRE